MQRGRFYSERDQRLIASINGELMGDIVENLVQLFKISPNETKTNIYGETSAETGKWYLPGIMISAFVDRPEPATQFDAFGPDRTQDYIFKFRRKMLMQLNFYPEIGDIVLFNSKYYNISNVSEEQLLGGIPEKSFSVVCSSNYERIASLNVLKRNS